MQKTLRIKNDIHELSMMNQFLEEAGEELGLSTAFMMSLNLVMEEAVSNIIFYAYKGDVEDAVDISLVREGGELIVTLIDHGIAFDPTLRKDPDITLSAEDRPIGGPHYSHIPNQNNRHILLLPDSPIPAKPFPRIREPYSYPIFL